MLNKAFVIAIAASLVALAGCCHEDDESAGQGAGGAGGTGGGANTAPTLPACNSANVPAGEVERRPGDTLRITMNGDGTINKFEGKNGAGLWEDARQTLTSVSPSQGACIVRLEMYALNNDPTVLNNPPHGHAGGAHTGTSPHCHRLYTYQGGSTLVHC